MGNFTATPTSKWIPKKLAQISVNMLYSTFPSILKSLYFDVNMIFLYTEHFHKKLYLRNLLKLVKILTVPSDQTLTKRRVNDFVLFLSQSEFLTDILCSFDSSIKDCLDSPK